MTQLNSPCQNLLLGALPLETYKRLLPDLELIQMSYGEVIYMPGSELRYAYFPTTSLVSNIYIVEDGTSSELAIVGYEGFIGLGLFTGGRTMPHQAVVTRGGYGYRLRRQLFIKEFESGDESRTDRSLFQLLLRYIQALITQIAQTAACNRHHSIYQQLCRWLLLNLDRHSSNEMLVTHDQIANMLGVRRESITDAAGKLQQKGLISYSRGHINVLNRAGLETQVCECYQVIKTEFDRLIPAFVQAPENLIESVPSVPNKSSKHPIDNLILNKSIS
ncbi:MULTISPECIES: Crp/Fnr family transcriptional regulator [Methylomonas]|uniref:Crp/Fnr family transcriptional regulator n=2 Tax=Methylomonas TaxID=416 RepID=A0A126T9T2_9GAMM|nr:MULTISPECIES: Crp/Fnr family transcriptional regulator [Methylomonas]AMK78554.1 Crp/Fnr family transcriptional regulator [Methylomonas denitrificans]OAI06464.1 Crp/Fnr family transcriptional regulator [Methylomonas methanica]TCV77388.1 CRP-like cAMP-binding protein [Methylomonas methanica]